MAIVKRRRFARTAEPADFELDRIDTPEKLLLFAESKGVTTTPLDIEKVIGLFGVQLEYINMDDDISGMLKKNESGNWLISVNQDHHPNRQRYTLAHELGHYCLHKHLENDFEDRIYFRGGDTNEVERQANNFANEILMPESRFKSYIRDGITRIDDLASKFKVSSLALRLRAKNLGIEGHGL